MRILVDEDLPIAVARLLESLGHDAEHVVEVGLRGKTDREVYDAAQRRGAMLFTADVGFGNRLIYTPTNGIVLLRFPDHFRRAEIVSLVRRFLEQADLTLLADALVVVSPGGYRVRR